MDPASTRENAVINCRSHRAQGKRGETRSREGLGGRGWGKTKCSRILDTTKRYWDSHPARVFDEEYNFIA